MNWFYYFVFAVFLAFYVNLACVLVLSNRPKECPLMTSQPQNR